MVVALFGLIPFPCHLMQTLMHIGSNTTHDQGALRGQHSSSRAETNLFPSEESKHRLHNLLYDFAF
jgi:hypothetical protein